MAIVSEITTNWMSQKKRIILILSAFLFLSSLNTFATTPDPVLLSSTRETGELTVCYSNVPIGATVLFFESTYDLTTWTNTRSWYHSGQSCMTLSPYENGQTVHYYIRYRVGSDSVSNQSNRLKQTPPTTTFVTNFSEILSPLTDLFNELIEAVNNLDVTLEESFTDIVYPSDEALNDLSNSIDDLKDALGVSELNEIGNQINDDLENAQSGMTPPFINDGINTFTGGNPLVPVYTNKSFSGLTVPDLESGTDTPLSFVVPITKLPDGSYFNIKIFTEEQLDKLKWLGVVREILIAMLWIGFAIFIIVRFTPAFKV